jgi:hypothetical protein
MYDKIAIVVACCFVVGVLAYSDARIDSLKLQNAELKAALQASETARAASDAALAAKATATVLTTKRKVSQNAALSKAVKESPDWADSPVPSSVAAAVGM